MLQIAIYGLLIGLVVLVVLFGIGYVAALATIPMRAEPVDKAVLRQRRAERRARSKARDEQEQPVLGVRWRFVARYSVLWVPLVFFGLFAAAVYGLLIMLVLPIMRL